MCKTLSAGVIVTRTKSFDDLIEKTVSVILEQGYRSIELRGKFMIAVSGGKTPRHLFRSLRRHKEFPWEKTSFFWIDERCVPPDHPESNYGMVEEEFLRHVTTGPVFRMLGEAEDLERAANEYQNVLYESFNCKPGEVPVFDFILFGIGEDGHVASLFPRSPLLFEQNKLVASVFVPQLQSCRLTMTLPLLNNCRCGIFMVTGKTKASILDRCITPDTGNLIPANYISLTNGVLYWITDIPEL